MNRNYRFRLYPSKVQEMEMLEVLDSCRRLYNHFLGEWKKTKKIPSKYDLQAQIPSLVKKHSDLKNVYSRTRQYVLWQLYSNLRGLRGLKDRDRKVGRLRFKKYGRYKSFVYNHAGFWLIDNKLHLTKIGEIPIKLHREINGEIKQVIVKREQSGKWFAIFSIETEIEKLGTTNKAVGLDLNIDNYLADSKGEKVEHPHTLLRLEEKLAREQRRISRMKKGSKNRVKQVYKVARIHEKITDRRRDFLHKLSHYYVDNCDIIAVEDLAVKAMRGSSYNAKNTVDSSWSTFIQMLSYKAEGAGRTLVKVDPKNTTQNCSRCGNRVYKQIWVREHRCPSCGLIIDRDYNAARNVLNKALLEVGSVRPELTPVEMEPLSHQIGEVNPVVESGISFQKL